VRGLILRGGREEGGGGEGAGYFAVQEKEERTQGCKLVKKEEGKGEKGAAVYIYPYRQKKKKNPFWEGRKTYLPS